MRLDHETGKTLHDKSSLLLVCIYIAAIGMSSAPKVNRIYHGIAAADVVLIDKPGNCAFNRVYCACVDVEITQDCMVLQWLCVCFQANCYIGTLFASPKCNFLRFLPVFQTHQHHTRVVHIQYCTVCF